MKIIVDKEFIASTTGLLRLGTLGFGGAVFGTLAQNAGVLQSPTSQLLMWIAVFAWIISTITFITGLFSCKLFAEGTEYRVNLLIAILYLIITILYGVWDINLFGGLSRIGLLVFLYAAVNFVLYLVLSAIQLCSSDAGKKLKEAAKEKKAKKVKKSKKGTEEKEQDEAIDPEADAVVENGKDEEPEAEQARVEENDVQNQGE